jgi:ribosome biogenesis GTPase
MPKRKLNKQQTTQVNKRRSQNLTYASNHQHLGESQDGLVITNFGKKLLVEDKNGNLYNCSIRQHLGKMVAGDEVIWQTDIEKNAGIVTFLKPRRQELSRPGFRGQTRMIAANIDLLAIVGAIEPGIHPDMLDRYLVVAYQLKLPVFIVINKIDLITSDKQWQAIAEILVTYDEMDIDIYPVSAQTNQSMDKLRGLLSTNNSVFVGQSGVGKSSLIKTLAPDIEIKTNQLSKSTRLGKHTTTNSILYHLPEFNGNIGNIIDSPGVRQFSPIACELQELEQAYQDFEPFLGKCKFNNCTHTIEPKCAIKQAVEDNKLSYDRYHSFQRLMDEFKKTTNH